MPRSKEVTAAINNIESELDLFSFRNTCALWDYIRMNIWYDLKESKSPVSTGNNAELDDIEESRTNHRRILYNAVSNFINNNPLFMDTRNILFHGFARRNVGNDGKKWCPYCDPIVECLDLPWGFLENPRLSPAHRESGELHDKPARTSEIKYTDFFTLIPPLLNKLGTPDLFIDDVDDRIYTAINRLCDEFNRDLDVDRAVSSAVLTREIEMYMYEKILERVDPSVVVTVNRGRKLALIEAADNLNIPTVLLQQGTIYNSHIGFSYPKNIDVSTIPDYLFIWGEFWKDMVDIPITDNNIRIVGWPFFDIERSKYRSSIQRDNILIISQPHIGDRLADYAIDIARNQDRCTVIFRPHPNIGNLATERYPQLAESSVSIIHDEPLYKLFSEARAQVGYSSTAIFEGLGFGLETYIVEGSDKEHMKKLLNKKGITSVSSSDEICTEIKNAGDKKPFDTELFFKDNSEYNIKKEIKGIISSS